MGCTDVTPKVAAVCGVKNSGKTTLLENLIKSFADKGCKVAVIKHDGHDFTCDIPGTDSCRYCAAGAAGAAVYSGNQSFIHRMGMGDGLLEMIQAFPEADLILVEGEKNSSLPKVEVVRKEISGEAVSNPQGRFLIVTDWEKGHFLEETLSFKETGTIAERIWKHAVSAREWMEGKS